MNNSNSLPVSAGAEAPVADSVYEAPSIERIITPDEVAREVLYAGGDPISIPGEEPVLP